MLWRNFGVTRHGRVVFYDYDEIEYLTDCVFRAIPPPPNPEAELADEAWYAVGRARRLPGGVRAVPARRPRVREAFLEHHAELLEPEFWQRLPAAGGPGEVVDFFPYPESARFCERFADGAVLDLRAAGHL